ncbi:AfsR/SARP family transcriptional regulator [Micromonospora sp. CA-259024]|uniref:AfsR/SARP family transcriptional regulator n=1 Tax=Micromonospora sp. CA-259024 TaxID=3239965 RepID=UPI003D8A5129
MRWPRQLMSLLVVLALLAGPPVVLVLLVGPPVRGWPSTEQVRAWVQQPLTEQTLTAALTIGAWLLWLLLAYTVAVRALIRLRRTVGWLRRLPLPTPLQATASGMAGAAVFGVATNTVTIAPPQPSPPLTAGMPEDSDGVSPIHEDTAASDDGIHLAGGWLPDEVAEQVAAAAALVWLRRRRDYRPHQPDPNRREELNAAGLPPTVAAVQAALADAPAPSVAPEPSGSFAALVGVFPVGGVGVSGPGTLSIGRGLLITALLAGQHLRTPTLVTTRATLTSLLGGNAQALDRRLPQLNAVETIHDATRLVESAPSLRIVLLLEEECDGYNVRDLADMAAMAGGRAVVLGGWPAGPTWQAAPTGHLHDPSRPEEPGPRLCVLDQVAATDLLAVIVHPDPAPPTPATPHPPLPHVAPPKARLPRQATRGEPRSRPDASTRRLRLRVLGEPTLLVDGEPLTIRRSAALQILVFLAAAHPTGADTPQLTDAIWPGVPRRSLTGRLYTTLSELRTAIRDASGLHVIEHTDDRYRLNPAHLNVDLWQLQAAIHHAATAVTNTTAAWQTVVDAYPADLAAGRTWPWLDPIRETTRRHVIDACAALADAEPDPQRGLAVLQAGLRIDPYNADLHARARSALTAHGDHEAATELHDHYLRLLSHAGLDDNALDRLSNSPSSRTGASHE